MKELFQCSFRCTKLKCGVIWAFMVTPAPGSRRERNLDSAERGTADWSTTFLWLGTIIQFSWYHVDTFKPPATIVYICSKSWHLKNKLPLLVLYRERPCMCVCVCVCVTLALSLSLSVCAHIHAPHCSNLTDECVESESLQKPCWAAGLMTAF